MAGRIDSTDEQLLSRMGEGDDRAFTELYNRHRRAIYTYLQKFLKSPELSEDLTQEVFIKLLEEKDELSQVHNFKAYLFTLARNHAFNFLKRAATDSNAKAEILRHYPQNQSLENALHYNDYLRYLNEILATLSPQSREVFRLCRQEGKTYDETAEILGISRNTVKKHMVRSMRILGDSVEKDLGISLTVLLAVLLLNK